jgi:hypothetical protein
VERARGVQADPARLCALQAHIAASPNLRGIRGPYAAGGDARFAEAMALLEKHGLVFDLGAAFDKLHGGSNGRL